MLPEPIHNIEIPKDVESSGYKIGSIHVETGISIIYFKLNLYISNDSGTYSDGDLITVYCDGWYIDLFSLVQQNSDGSYSLSNGGRFNISFVRNIQNSPIDLNVYIVANNIGYVATRIENCGYYIAHIKP